jgi:hypothetical protein
VWIGGGTSAGKTSIARGLARRYGLTSYHVDQHELDHARRRVARRHPAMEACTHDPTRSQAHRIERDTLLVERVREQALARGLAMIDVDGSRPLAGIEVRVASHLAPYLPV